MAGRSVTLRWNASIIHWMMDRIRRIGLQQRIMIYVTAGLLVFSAIYGFLALEAVQQSTDLVFRERLLSARTIAHEIDQELAHLRSEFLDATTVISANSSPPESLNTTAPFEMACDRWIAFRHYEQGCSILLTDARGRILSWEPNTGVPATLAFAPGALEGGIAFAAADPSQVQFATPLRTADEITGYAIWTLDRHDVGLALESALEIGGTDYVVELIDRSGQVVAGNRPKAPPPAGAHLRLVNPLWEKGQSGVREHVLPNGGHVIAFAPLATLTWGVIVEQRSDEAFLLPRNLLMQFSVLGFFALLGGLVLAWVTTRTVVRPINALINASREIARGNLDYPLDTSGGAEVGILARSFAEMRVRLKQSHEEIALWNDELAARIQQRTRELGALVESSHALTSTLDLDVLFDILMKHARAVLPSAEGVALFLVEPGTQNLAVRSNSGFDAIECEQVRFQIGEGVAGQVYANQKPMLVCTAGELESAQANLSIQNRTHFQRAVGDRTVHSAMGVPVVSKGARLGVLVLYNFAAEGAFGENDVPILQALADQAAAAIENAQLYAELQRKEAIRTQLLEKVIEAQEQEHKRIARELHDEFAQTLTALTINLQSTAQTLPPEQQDLKQRLSETQSLTTQMLKEISQWILELRPTVLDDLGLVPAIRWYAENRLEASKAKVEVEAVGFKRRLPLSIETSLFRITQEAITNVAKYAQATRVYIRVENANGHIVVKVEDNGIGFNAEDALSLKDGIRGLGLLGMRERATLLGGTLAIDARQGGGTRIQAEVPWTQME